MDIRKRFGSNIFAVKMSPIVGISTIGDGLGSILSEFYRIFLHRSHISHSDFRNQEYKKLRFNGNSDTLKSKLS